MWLHASFGHIAMNMFMLWMFGSQLALAWGPKRFLRFYLICGVGSRPDHRDLPLLDDATCNPHGLIAYTLGASGAVYGVLLGYSLTWPDRTIMLIFPPVAFRAIWLIPGLFLMSMMFSGGQNISHIGHLGGGDRRLDLPAPNRVHANAIFSLGQLKSRWKRRQMRKKLRSRSATKNSKPSAATTKKTTTAATTSCPDTPRR